MSIPLYATTHRLRHSRSFPPQYSRHVPFCVYAFASHSRIVDRRSSFSACYTSLQCGVHKSKFEVWAAASTDWAIHTASAVVHTASTVQQADIHVPFYVYATAGHGDTSTVKTEPSKCRYSSAANVCADTQHSPTQSTTPGVEAKM